MAEIKGADLLAKSLKDQGVEFMFGVVGFPVGPLAEAAQKVGLPYIGMRNEQAASYAAGAVGFLTGRPGSCIVVTGPGVIHGLAGLANAQQNCWPMILIGGASETYRNGMGAFQEERQVLAATPVSKWAHGDRARQPHSVLCRDGGQAVDLRPPRRDLSRLSRRHHHRLVRRRRGDPGRTNAPSRRARMAMPQDIDAALDVLAIGAAPAGADRPGHGVFARRPTRCAPLSRRTQMPFVRTRQGQGRDAGRPPAVGRRRTHPGAAAGRCRVPDGRAVQLDPAFRPAAALFNKDVKVIQLDIEPEAMHQNKPAEVALLGDGKAIVAQLNQALARPPVVPPGGFAVARRRSPRSRPRTRR